MKDRIKELRKSVGMSQTEFGESLGVSLSAVRKWESGENVISDSVIKLIAQKYKVSEAWLRTGGGSMRAETNRAEELAALVAELMADRPDSFKSSLITALLKLRPDQWSLLEDIYNSIKKTPED